MAHCFWWSMVNAEALPDERKHCMSESQYKMPILLMILVRNETEWVQLTRIFSFSNWSARSFVDGGIGLTIHSFSRSHSPVQGSSCWENNPFTFHTHFERRSRDDAHSMKSAISYYRTPANVAHTHSHPLAFTTASARKCECEMETNIEYTNTVNVDARSRLRRAAATHTRAKIETGSKCDRTNETNGGARREGEREKKRISFIVPSEIIILCEWWWSECECASLLPRNMKERQSVGPSASGDVDKRE